MINPLISAWIGRGNFGDELLAYGLRLELNETGQVNSVNYYKSGSYPLFEMEGETRIVCVREDGGGYLKKLIEDELRWYGGYDTLIFGGGSIFHSLNSVRWKRNLLRKFRRNRFLGAKPKVGCVGVSMGPFKSAEAEATAIKFIRELDFLHCRDSASYAFARDNTKSPQIVNGRDLAFSVRALRPELFACPKVRGLVGISFLPVEHRIGEPEGEILGKMLAVVNRLTEQGFSVMLISLYCGKECRDDILHNEIYRNAIRRDAISLHHYRGDVVETLRRIVSCDLYISMRLHGLIAAFLSGTPALSLHSSKKIIDFKNDLYHDHGALINGDIYSTVDELLQYVDDFVQTRQSRESYPIYADRVYKSSSRKLMRILSDEGRGK